MRPTIAQYFAAGLAEFTGSAILTNIGCMSTTNIEAYSRDLFETAVAFGLVVTLAIHTFGFLSGCHINPSVTLASLIMKGITWDMAIMYWILQMLGGLAGYGLLALLMPTAMYDQGNGLCVTIPHATVNVARAVFVEFICTASLIFLCCAIWDDRNEGTHESVSLRLGLFVTAMVLTGGHYTGASMNFMRTFAPNAFHGAWEPLWQYALGQLLGSLVPPAMWLLIFDPFWLNKDDDENQV